MHKSITYHSYNTIIFLKCITWRDTASKTCGVFYSALCAPSQSRFSIRQRRRRVPAVRVSRQWTVPRWAIAPHTNWISLVARAYDRSGNLSARETSRRIDGGEIPEVRGRGRALVIRAVVPTGHHERSLHAAATCTIRGVTIRSPVVGNQPFRVYPWPSICRGANVNPAAVAAKRHAHCYYSARAVVARIKRSARALVSRDVPPSVVKLQER